MPGQTDVVDIPDRAGLDDPVVGRLIHRVVVTLVADFEDPVVPLGGHPHPLASLDVPGHHLLAEHVLAGLQTADGEVRMRPQRWRHDDRFDVFLLQHFAPVRIVARRRHRVLCEHGVRERQLCRIDVAERAHLRVIGVDVPELCAPLGADADESKADAPARHRAAKSRGHAKGRQGWSSRQGPEEVAASLVHLFGGEIHTAVPFMLAVAVGEGHRNRSNPAMEPVRHANTTATAHASIRVLLTRRYVPSARASSRPVGIAAR